MVRLLQVVRGADKNIDLHIRMENGITVEKFQWTNEGSMDTTVNKTGLIFAVLTSYM